MAVHPFCLYHVGCQLSHRSSIRPGYSEACSPIGLTRVNAQFWLKGKARAELTQTKEMGGIFSLYTVHPADESLPSRLSIGSISAVGLK